MNGGPVAKLKQPKHASIPPNPASAPRGPVTRPDPLAASRDSAAAVSDPPATDRAGSRAMGFVSCLAPLLLIALGLRFGSAPGFAQWDSFEAFLPAILWAHRCLLAGELPLWNPMQNLGEPLHAMGVGGVFYFPYTLATLWVDALHWDPRSVMDVIAASHAAFAGLGLYLLCRSFGVRPLVSMVAAVSAPMSGFILYVGSVWIHTLPNLAWGVWAAWAAKSVVDRHRVAVAAPVAALALALPFNAGHIQPAVYNVVVSAGFALAYALVRRRPSALPWLLAIWGAAALLAMPAILPTAALVPETLRSAGVTAVELGGRSVRLGALIGLLLPVFRGTDGFIDEVYLDTLFAGGWLVPALLGGLALVIFRRRALAALARGPHGLPPSTAFLLTGASALGVLVLSLGDQTPVYSWTRVIPMWSSFRWPFKLFLHALPFLVTAGALGLELLLRVPGAAMRRAVGLGSALLALALWFALPGLGTPAANATGVLGLVAMLAVAWLELPAARVVLGVVAVLEAGGMLLVTQRPDRYKTYVYEKVGAFGPREFGISPDFRLVPLSPSVPDGERMQELGLYQSATLDGYYGLTGHRFALSSIRLVRFVPTGDEGILSRRVAPTVLGSHLLKSYNVRYALAAKYDSGAVRGLDELPGWRRLRETPHAIVYENPAALSRMYFASEVELYSPEQMFAALVQNQAPVTSAYVEGERRQRFAAPGRVVRFDWGHDRITADLEAATSGFLVVSMSHSPDWVATLDGRTVPLELTNGTISGLRVPAGARHLVLHYEPRSFWIGVWAALAGAVVLLGTTIALARHPMTHGS